jgi:hypothetical protein
MVFAFHAIEAYLNYVGMFLAPSIWANEREFFKKEPFRGFDGKIRKVFELCDLVEPDREARPYQTIWKLKELRDLIAHGKPQRIDQSYQHPAGTEAPTMDTELSHLVTREKTCFARDDVLSVATVIHIAARAKIDDVWFNAAGPFEGVLSYGVGSTSAA